jgi:hypothetical protein
MIELCPHCGHKLTHPILRGISSCNNCNRIFDSSPFNRILSAAWLVRRHHISDQDYLVDRHGCHPVEAELVMEFVSECLYSHEEMVKLLETLKIPKVEEYAIAC